MRTTLMVFSLMLLPALADAQSVTLAGGARTNSLAASGRPRMAVEARSRIEAQILRAEARGLPGAPLYRLFADGEARFASESRISGAIELAESHLMATKEAFAQFGRRASDDEMIAGAEAMSQGASEAHIAALVRSAPRERSLVVALNTLAGLASRGESVTEGVMAIEQRLAAGAPDANIKAVGGVRNR